MCDVITIGSATMDVFVESDDANIVSVYTKNKKSEFMSYPYGAKVEITDFASKVGGGGVNTAVNFANLGYKTSAIFKIGDDIYSDGILESFKNKNIDLTNIIQDAKISTGFSIILVSFQGDRTVLAHRGANAMIIKSDINFEAKKNGYNQVYCTKSGSIHRNRFSRIESHEICITRSRKKGTAGSRKIQLFSECCCNSFIYESHQDFRTLGCR